MAIEQSLRARDAPPVRRALNGTTHTAGANGVTACSLYYGKAKTALVQIVPDDRWPRMWRMLWPDGQISDMANLSRIRDAAAAICERGPPARYRRIFRWDTSNRRAEGPPVRQNAAAVLFPAIKRERVAL